MKTLNENGLNENFDEEQLNALNSDCDSDNDVAVEEGLSFAEFNNNCQLDEFDIFAFLENFRPSSVDPERLFSLCRLSRNYLQNRLSPENHSRNVFLNKNKRFLK